MWLTVITDARWLVVIWIGDGKRQVKFCTQQSITRSSWSPNFRRKESWQYSVIFMDTHAARISSCMGVIILPHPKTPDCFPSFFRQSIRSSFTLTQGLEIKSQKSRPRAWLCSMNTSSIPASTLWSHRSVVMMRDLSPSITFPRRTWCRQEPISADLYWFTSRSLVHSLSSTCSLRIFWWNWITIDKRTKS